MSPPAMAQIARVTHLALVASSLVVAGLLSWLPPIADLEQRSRLMLLTGTFLLGLALCVVPIMIASRLPQVEEDDLPRWWARHFPAAVVVWALFEAAAAIGAVCRFVTGDEYALVLPAAAILLLVWHSPGRLAGR
jgi:hypothetical protein